MMEGLFAEGRFTQILKKININILIMINMNMQIKMNIDIQILIMMNINKNNVVNLVYDVYIY